MTRSLTILVVLAACGGGDRPKLTPELIPPTARPLMLGTSTEADVLKMPFLKAPGTNRETIFNDHKSTLISERSDAAAYEFYLWADDGGERKLGRFTITAPEGCAWVIENVGKLDGAENCPGNRKTGASTGRAGGTVATYCLRDEVGHVVWVECGNNRIEYWLGKKR